jgi:hypothetical protein
MLGLNLPSVLRPASAFASSSRLTLAPIVTGQIRFRSDLAPRRTKYRKAQKGRVSIPTVSIIVHQ